MPSRDVTALSSCYTNNTEFSLCLLKGVGEGCVLGGVTNHIKAFKLQDQRDFLLKALKFKHLKYAEENTATCEKDNGEFRKSKLRHCSCPFVSWDGRS